MVDEKVFIVDIEEKTTRVIWKSSDWTCQQNWLGHERGTERAREEEKREGQERGWGEGEEPREGEARTPAVTTAF